MVRLKGCYGPALHRAVSEMPAKDGRWCKNALAATSGNLRRCCRRIHIDAMTRAAIPRGGPTVPLPRNTGTADAASIFCPPPLNIASALNPGVRGELVGARPLRNQ